MTMHFGQLCQICMCCDAVFVSQLTAPEEVAETTYRMGAPHENRVPESNVPPDMKALFGSAVCNSLIP